MGSPDRSRERDRDEVGARLQRPRAAGDDLPAHWRRLPPFAQDQAKKLKQIVVHDEPADHGLSGGWTRGKLAEVIRASFGFRPCESVLSKVLRSLGLSYRKAKKLLGKANPEERKEYIDTFKKIYTQMVAGDAVIIYVDEAHFHRDVDLGYTWGERGKATWSISQGAPLSDRLNWYGAYDFEAGQCMIWNEGKNNGENTASFLRRLADWLGPERTAKAVIIWDNAPAHTAKIAQKEAESLGMKLQALPVYSPDLNPIEGLWKWMRSEVTRNTYYPTMRSLFDACKAFVERINQDPDAIIGRLWPVFELDPEVEKLRIPA